MAKEKPTCTASSSSKPKRLRPLVISMGGARQETISSMFSNEPLSSHFEPPVFIPGVPSRALRSRHGLMKHAHEAGLIRADEYEAFISSGGMLPRGGGDFDAEEKAKQNGTTDSDAKTSSNDNQTSTPHNAWENIPIAPPCPSWCHENPRRGSQFDQSMHYSSELWRKAKSLNRDRAVLACTLAHLIAMKRFVSSYGGNYTNSRNGREQPFDIILEDNVRPIVSNHDDDHDCDVSAQHEAWCEAAARIRGTQEAISFALPQKHTQVTKSTTELNNNHPTCHLLYYGWLGSVRNLTWVMQTHAPKTTIPLSSPHGTFPFPTSQQHYQDDAEVHVGGTALWGMYAYAISPPAYQAVLDKLRSDVGALLWKGKRMKHYVAKPVDKIVPRAVLESKELKVRVAVKPSFFRAPMLTSRIHAKWDPEFCQSTEYQLQHCITESTTSVHPPKHDEGAKTKTNTTHETDKIKITWDHLWLTSQERKVVQWKRRTGKWITMQELEKKTPFQELELEPEEGVRRGEQDRDNQFA